MSVTRDIAATYRGPGKVIRGLLGAGAREDRALAILMSGCAVAFVAQWPRLAREAHLSGEALNTLLAGSLMGLLIFLPLVLFALAFFVQIVFVAVPRAELSGFGSRMALFWAFLAASPLMLLHGLTAGFVGKGIELSIVGLIWFVVFIWFWIAGAFAAARSDAGEA